MATKIRKHTSQKQAVRFKRKKRIRAKMEGTAEKPRFCVFRSNKNLYVQLIDDVKGVTLASASTLDEDLRGKVKPTIDGAKSVGTLAAKRAMAKNIKAVVFDRNGFIYHGQVKAIADAAREAGLLF